METWIWAIEGLVIVALLAVLLVRQRKDNSGEALKSASREIARELKGELEVLFQRARTENMEQGSIARREMQESFFLLRKQSEEQWVRQNEVQELNWRSADQRINNLLRDSEQRMGQLQEKVEKKLEEMRRTVDEQLNETLHKRVQSSFEAVGKQLESLQLSLGKVEALRTDVTSLQKVFSNVKTRGTWGEVQLGVLLEQILAPQQYARNVKVVPRSQNFVEYAIRLPGKDEEKGEVWLPIDSKFPVEDYLLLTDAQEKGDAALAREQSRRIQERIKSQAREIRDKYIEPPYTTEFAILYLPTEGLYAEAIRFTGLIETIQRECRVTVAGPTTLAAVLNSLQMGFKTLAVQKYSSEVWQLLGAVKKTMEIHAKNLDKAYSNLQTSVNQLGDARKNVNTIHNRLDRVEDIPEQRLSALLPELALPPEDEDAG
jgi:DNA recombination protein RmuC